MYWPFKKNRKSSSVVDATPAGADAVTAPLKLAVEFPIKVVFFFANCFRKYVSAELAPPVICASTYDLTAFSVTKVEVPESVKEVSFDISFTL